MNQGDIFVKYSVKVFVFSCVIVDLSIETISYKERYITIMHTLSANMEGDKLIRKTLDLTRYHPSIAD